MNIKSLFFGVLSFAMVAVAGAQGSYSARDANFYIELRDWSRLHQYSSHWTYDQPRDARGWYYLGTALLDGMQQPSDAIPPLERATQLRHDWEAAWNALGLAYRDMQRYADAAEAFEQAVRLAPGNPSYWNNLASAYAGAEQTDRAEQALDAEQVQASRWASNDDWYALGNGYAKLGCFAKAVDAYEHAVHLDERVAEAWNNLGVAEEQLGHRPQALADYQRAAALGDDLGETNAKRLQSVPTRVRSAQAHAWPANHPG
jgi:tetratricopeptide (TPR) repeat protein